MFHSHFSSVDVFNAIHICVCASFVFYFSFYFLVHWLLSLVVVVVVVLFLAATFVYPTICQLSFNKRFEMFFLSLFVCCSKFRFIDRNNLELEWLCDEAA